jgi:Tol biopolymer transport system component
MIGRGQTTRVSVASDGSQGDEASGGVYGSLTTSPPPSISADGRYVAFASEATNLVDGDTNNAPDAFVHDRETGETTRVSVSSDGSQANARSSWGYASSLDLSGDGRYVVFQSDATNFVPDEFRGRADLYLHDRATGETRLIAVSSTGEAANYSGDYPVISQDGHFVAFLSKASNLVPGDTNDQWDVFVHEPDLP